MIQFPVSLLGGKASQSQMMGIGAPDYASKNRATLSSRSPLASGSPLVSRFNRTSGFSLVEIMVAMVIGMLGMIVMLQVFGAFESQKRTTTGSADAMNAGAIALYGVQRDIRQSGWGMAGTVESPLIGCVVAAPGLNPAKDITLAPVTINSLIVAAGDANTDTLLVVYGNGNGTVEGDTIESIPTGQIYAVHTPTAFKNGDLVVAEPQARPIPCTLSMTSVTATPAGPPNVNMTVAATVAGTTLGKLYDFGANPKVQAYAIRSGNLTVCDYRVNDCSLATAAFWVPIANNVVMLRAQYGRDTSVPMDGVVDIYDQTTPTPDDACSWLRASALQVALVARNSQPEKTAVTAAAPTWMGGTPIDLTAGTVAAGFTWQNYRYRVFETIVPLRNITSIGASSGC